MRFIADSFMPLDRFKSTRTRDGAAIQTVDRGGYGLAGHFAVRFRSLDGVSLTIPLSFIRMRARFVVIGLFLPATGLAQQSPTIRAQTAVRQLEERWRLAQQANDTVAFRELLAPDVTFVGTSGALRDRAGYINSRADSWIPRSAQFRVDELRLRVYGMTVIATGRETSTGPGVNATGRFTHVWARRGDSWSLVALQRTEIAPPR